MPGNPISTKVSLSLLLSLRFTAKINLNCNRHVKEHQWIFLKFQYLTRWNYTNLIYTTIIESKINIYCPIIKIHAVTSSEAQQLKLHESDYYTTSVGTDSVCDNIDDAIPATPFAMKDELRVLVLNIYATENFPQLVMFFQQEIHRNEGWRNKYYSSYLRVEPFRIN